MTSRPADPWTSDRAYEPYVGRWSRLVAARFLRWLPTEPGALWCDVGCGTGALSHTILTTQRPAGVLGIDPSRAFLAAADRGASGPPFGVVVGTATVVRSMSGRGLRGGSPEVRAS